MSRVSDPMPQPAYILGMDDADMLPLRQVMYEKLLEAKKMEDRDPNRALGACREAE
jgi:hypothetical protein